MEEGGKALTLNNNLMGIHHTSMLSSQFIFLVFSEKRKLEIAF